jgi:hypothetical protein
MSIKVHLMSISNAFLALFFETLRQIQQLYLLFLADKTLIHFFYLKISNIYIEFNLFSLELLRCMNTGLRDLDFPWPIQL